MRGARRTLDSHRSPRCVCKYCDLDSAQGHTQKQSVISRELRSVRARVLAQIDGDELVQPEEDVDPDANADADGGATAVEPTTVGPSATENGGHAEGDRN